ncbi:MAG TPA: hypothetical protein VLE89_00715 [Chlamydiales bacterium]|nr:hypothetical protein [Chlamydiales bacterium]
MKQRHKKILSGCIALSLAIHIGAISFIHRHSLWFSPQNPQLAGIHAPYLSLMDKKERDQILKEAFEAPAAAETKEQTTSIKPRPEMLKSSSLTAARNAFEDTAELFSYSLFQTPFPTPELLTFNILPKFSFPAEQRLDLFEHLPKDLIIPPSSPPPLLPPPPAFIEPTPLAIESPSPPIPEKAPSAPIAFSEPLLSSPSLGEIKEIVQHHIAASLPNVPKLPTLDELETASYSEAFDTDLVFLPREEGKGYIFALTLIPRPDLDLPRIRQNYTFLIDRSNSIQQDRLMATKSAVHKALEEMMPDDTFNIIAFDNKVEKLSPNPIPFNWESLARAEAFLEKVSLGSFFSQANIHRPLLLTVPGKVQEEEIHTAILLTDAETLTKKNDQRTLLVDWTQYNSGKVTLFTLGMKGDRHLGTLDTVSAFNRGKLSLSPTKRGLKRKLLKLMKTIRNPVAKNLACHAISRSPQSKIDVFPKPAQMPHLYLDQPYVILGTTETLDDFILFVQGRIKDRWLNIKKTISFLNARKGNSSLRGEWALQNAYGLYERYIRDDDSKHLTEARALLEPYDFQTAFE